jgi:predicted DNA-binding protein (MmcQ/YjbR family)
MPDRTADLLSFALSLPEAWEDHPWGDTVAKVGKRIFVFVGTDSITVKLDEPHPHALSVAGAALSGYGLGASGWVTVPIAGIRLQLLQDWIEESYRMIAPKRLHRVTRRVIRCLAPQASTWDLESASEVELAVDTREVHFDGLRGDEEGLRDLPVGRTLGRHHGHPALAGVSDSTPLELGARLRALELGGRALQHLACGALTAWFHR